MISRCPRAACGRPRDRSPAFLVDEGRAQRRLPLPTRRSPRSGPASRKNSSPRLLATKSEHAGRRAWAAPASCRSASGRAVLNRHSVIIFWRPLACPARRCAVGIAAPAATGFLPTGSSLARERETLRLNSLKRVFVLSSRSHGSQRGSASRDKATISRLRIKVDTRALDWANPLTATLLPFCWTLFR